MTNELKRPLPVVIDGRDDESGLGLVYRTLFANGLSFREALHWLQMKSWSSLNARELCILAWAIGVDREWLSHRMFIIFRGRPARRFGFMSHAFGEGAVNLTRNARVCPACVKRNKYMRAAWQFKGVCGCVEHNVILLDRCPRCHELVSWNRPAIDICACGQFLTSSSEKVQLPLNVANWIRWIETRLVDAETTISAPEFGLPPLLTTLSIDGAYRLVLAVGLLPSSYGAIRSPASELGTSSGMTDVIARGIDRLTGLDCDFREIFSLEPVIHMPTLERMKANAVAPPDSNCAAMMIDRLRRRVKHDSDKRGRYIRGQLSLFP